MRILQIIDSIVSIPELCNNSVNNTVSVRTDPPVISEGLLQFMSPRDSASKVEIIWTLVMISKIFSAQSCKGISTIFKAMFPSSVPEGFSLSPSKFSYLITDALGPYFREIMLKDAQKQFFSLQFDETTNSKGKKELQINIKFWSGIKNEIVAHHLETVFIGTAKAETVCNHILSTLNKGSMSLKNLISVGSDGPAVNQKIFSLLNEETLSIRGKSLLSVGTCNLHHVHNAFLKGLEAFGSDVPDLVIAVYYFFHGWPSRQEEYAASQKQVKVPHHAFIKHVPSRWLTLKDAAKRLLEQWPALQHYFLKILPQHKSLSLAPSYNKISSFLKKKTMKAEIHFIISSSEIFQNFSNFFQKEEPLIHLLHEHFVTLLQTLMGRVCKGSEKEQQLEITSLANFDNEHLLAPKDVECGQMVVKEMKSLSERDQLEIRIGVKKHYVACGKYLLKKMHKMLKLFSCLQPLAICETESLKNVMEIAKALPGEIEVDLLLDEWKLLQAEYSRIRPSPMRIDHFWREIFKIKNYAGHEKYPNIEKVVKMCLSVSHGSADVERGFSLSSRILTKERASMNERTLNARLNVIDGLKLYNNDPVQVPITKELLKLSQNAHHNYKIYCEEQKKKETEKIKDQKRKRCLKDEESKTAKKMKTDIQNIKSDLNIAKKKYQEKKETREKLFVEANQRLKKAISNNNILEISLAQAMMEGVESIKSEETELGKNIANLQKAIDKKTSSFISKFALQNT